MLELDAARQAGAITTCKNKCDCCEKYMILILKKAKYINDPFMSQGYLTRGIMHWMIGSEPLLLPYKALSNAKKHYRKFYKDTHDCMIMEVSKIVNVKTVWSSFR